MTVVAVGRGCVQLWLVVGVVVGWLSWLAWLCLWLWLWLWLWAVAVAVAVVVVVVVVVMIIVAVVVVVVSRGNSPAGHEISVVEGCELDQKKDSNTCISQILSPPPFTRQVVNLVSFQT